MKIEAIKIFFTPFGNREKMLQHSMEYINICAWVEGSIVPHFVTYPYFMHYNTEAAIECSGRLFRSYTQPLTYYTGALFYEKATADEKAFFGALNELLEGSIDISPDIKYLPISKDSDLFRALQAIASKM